MHTFFLQIVPLTLVRHNDLPCYVAEGFGGKSIEEWPIYSFFIEYLNGDTEGARRKYESWYRDQLSKYATVSKKEGGMYLGSLYRLIEERSQKPFADTDEQCRGEVIRERVEQRFALLDTIQTEGYHVERAERIDAVRVGGLVYLRGGHHRAAALKALKYNELPGVLVFPNRCSYQLFNFLRTIRYGNF